MTDDAPGPATSAESRLPGSFAGSGPSSIARGSRGVLARTGRGLLAIWLPGVYAWGATVAMPAFSVEASTISRVAAAVALVALLLGPLLALHRRRLGRGVGVVVFSGACAGVWTTWGGSVPLDRLDPLRGGLGFLAFCLYGLGWGSFPERFAEAGDGPEDAAPLEPRAALSGALGLGFAVLVVGALSLPLLAFRIDRPATALLGHALGVAGAIAVLDVGTRVLLIGQADGVRPTGASRRTWLLAAWIGLGAALWAYRALGLGGGP
jgi:hypothetical protein